jgi:hypothetical protein
MKEQHPGGKGEKVCSVCCCCCRRKGCVGVSCGENNKKKRREKKIGGEVDMYGLWRGADRTDGWIMIRTWAIVRFCPLTERDMYHQISYIFETSIKQACVHSSTVDHVYVAPVALTLWPLGFNFELLSVELEVSSPSCSHISNYIPHAAMDERVAAA